MLVQPLGLLSPLYPLVLAHRQASRQSTLLLSKRCHLFACQGRGKVRFNVEHLLPGFDWETLGSLLRSSDVQGSLGRTSPQGGTGCFASSVFSLPELSKKLERRTSKGSLPPSFPPPPVAHRRMSPNLPSPLEMIRGKCLDNLFNQYLSSDCHHMFLSCCVGHAGPLKKPL